MAPQTKSAENAAPASSTSSSPIPSSNSSTSDLKGMEKAPTGSKGKSMKDRSKIPNSMYIVYGSIIGLQYFGGMWSVDTPKSWYSSMTTSGASFYEWMGYTRDLTKSAVDGDYADWKEYATTGIISFFGLSLFYVFIIAPLMAGFWTGPKTKKHKFHRYMGLLYLLQYFLAWVEFLTNYTNGAAASYLPHFIALNGILQGTSAYFSFKVLPELEDPGYYSDKAVLSRNFVHENIFFTLMCIFGSVYYNEQARETLRSNVPGRIIECIYIFWPYILVRTWFPITRFKNAGSTHKGRTDKNEKFYQVATSMVKFFYLWAKYFLGFFVNFMVFLDILKEDEWKFLHGMFLLNLGTVSISIFLHTLRFKKVLPARLTMTLYLMQIYATFTAVPLAYRMFISHPKLCGVAFAGLLCNMTRNRKIHAAWCFCTMILLTADTGIEW